MKILITLFNKNITLEAMWLRLADDKKLSNIRINNIHYNITRDLINTTLTLKNNIKETLNKKLYRY
jgi:hypothetical protein